MGMKTKPSKANAKKVVMPSKEAIMDCNNNEAGELLLSKLVNDKLSSTPAKTSCSLI